MKLKQIVCDKTDLTLTKEKKKIKYGEIFGEKLTEERINEILATTFKDKPVAELVIEEPKEEKPKKETKKK